ncbi:MAG: hypothetical protein WD751_07510 [Anaerolineales bacterium]
MLFREPFLEGVRAGTLSTAFRRWTQPRVKVGTRMRTPIGVVEVLSVQAIMEIEITSTDAARAGYASRAELQQDLSPISEGQLYRVVLKYGGEDPRIQLREAADLSVEDFAAIQKKLKGYEREGAWTRKVLKLIAKNENVLASKLAKKMGMEKYAFKRRVWQLKELGLTKSLDIGYRLSPRGRAYLEWLES